MNAPLQHHHDDVLAEHALARRLRQDDIDYLLSLGIPPLAMACSLAGRWSFIGRERCAFDDQGRFEFERYRPESAANAFTFPVFDEWGAPVDIFGFRPGQRGLWLGRVDMLGAENVFAPRLGSLALDVHADAVAWLAAHRDGVVILNHARAFETLRLASTLRAQTPGDARRLRDALLAQMPKIVVRARAAAPAGGEVGV